jgi:tripartite-type tricarboxylate transporter receptor subunit TctC
MLGAAPLLLVVPANSPMRTLDDVLKASRAKNGGLTSGSPGIGTSPHMALELLADQSGVKFTHAPYKGSGPAVQDVIGGQLDMMFDTSLVVGPHILSGRLRPIAITGSQRVPSYPNVPTIAESGLPGYDATAWQGLVGPAGMNAEVVKKINEAFNKVMVTPALRDKLIAGGLDPMGGTPAQFSRFIDSEITKWTKIAKDVGAKAE